MKRRSFLRHTLEAFLLIAGGIYPWRSAVANPASVVKNLAFGSCAHQNDPQPIWNTIKVCKPDMFLFLGDNVYGDTQDMKHLAGQYKKLAAKPEFANFRSQIPLIATWDDHDYGVNDGGAEYPKKRESKKIFLDFFAEPLDSARRQRDGIYTSYIFGPKGKQLQLILLDLRWFRTALKLDPFSFPYGPTNDPKATMLGAIQWKWLEEELRKPADVRIIASSIQFSSPDHPWEKWANFPNEKKHIIKLIDQLKIRNLIFVSGDMHFGEISSEKTPGGFDIFDVTSSGLNFSENGSQYKNRNRVALYDQGPNFGFIQIDWDAKPIGVSLQVRNAQGKPAVRKDITIANV